MRLIDADALADVIEGTDWYHLTEIGTMAHGAVSGDNAWYREGDIFKALAEAPTIDAEVVCRCKDCKHRRHLRGATDEAYTCGLGWGLRGIVAEDDFCSYGERRGDTT